MNQFSNLHQNCYVMNPNLYSDIHKSKNEYHGLLCNFDKLDTMNDILLDRTSNSETEILLNPRPVSSLEIKDKTKKINTPFEVLTMEKDNVHNINNNNNSNNGNNGSAISIYYYT